MRRPLLAFSALLACMLVLPTVASAYIEPAGTYSRVKPIKGSNGIQIQIGKGRYTPGTVTVGTSQAITLNRGASTLYWGEGVARLRRLKAAFGTIARIDLRFVPNGRVTRRSITGCNGTEKARLGVWKGLFRFRGEGGYTRAKRTRIAGKLLSHPRLRCKPFPDSQVSIRAFLGADSPGRGPTYGVYRMTDGSTRHWAFMDERRDGFGIIRDAFAAGSKSSFVYNRRFTRGRVRPPEPFQGSGRFDSSSTPTWVGNLRVGLLGAGVQRLTGSRFEAQLARRQQDVETLGPSRWPTVRDAGASHAAIRSTIRGWS